MIFYSGIRLNINLESIALIVVEFSLIGVMVVMVVMKFIADY